jgi:hypothetical protein
MSRFCEYDMRKQLQRFETIDMPRRGHGLLPGCELSTMSRTLCFVKERSSRALDCCSFTASLVRTPYLFTFVSALLGLQHGF